MIYVVDFFCGAGGASLGFNKAGAHNLLGIDHKNVYRETYEQIVNPNGSHPHFLAADLFPDCVDHPQGQLSLVEREISKSLKDVNFRRSKEYLVFIVCAPCQPFSTMTSKLSETRKLQRQKDRLLLLSTLSLVEKFRPNFIFMENVAGIDKFDERNESILTIAFDYLEELKYNCKTTLVNTSNFGIAQNRVRQISVATSSKHRYDQSLPYKDPCSRDVVRVKDVLSKYPPLLAGESHPTIPNHIARNLDPINLLRLKHLKPGESNHSLNNTLYGDLSLVCHNNLAQRTKEKHSYGDTYTRMDPEWLAPTITTNCVSISNGRFGHYDAKQLRGISVREAAALQSFPDDFIFYPTDTLSPASVMIGNAVPPKLAQFYAEYMFKVLKFVI